MHGCQAVSFAKRLKSSRIVQYISTRQRVFDKGGSTFSPLSIPAERSVTAFSTMSELHYPAPDVLNADSHTATVIMLHGLGDTSAGWSPVGAQLKSQLPHVKWIFPNAPMRPITCNMGMKMPGWYDIFSMEGINSQEDAEGVTASAKYVKELVEKEVAAGTPANRIVVGGFSQGGAVAIMMLREMKELAGVIGLSCYLPLRNSASGVLAPEMKGVPVFMGHGTEDPLIPLTIGKMTFEVLQGLGSNIEIKTYPMAHSACPEELQDVAAFLKRVIP